MLHATKIETVCDTNGNPRRGWLITSETAIVDWIEESYAGRGALRVAYPLHCESPYFGDVATIEVCPTEYRRLRKLSAQVWGTDYCDANVVAGVRAGMDREGRL